MPKAILSPRAFQDVIDACDFLEKAESGLSLRFLDELSATQARIEHDPESFPVYVKTARYVQLKRFRYIVVYRIMLLHVEIIAVKHTSQDDSLLQDR